MKKKSRFGTFVKCEGLIFRNRNQSRLIYAKNREVPRSTFVTTRDRMRRKKKKDFACTKVNR